MKLTALEIERSRRSTELEATKGRIRLLSARIDEIVQEQAELNRILSTNMGSTAAGTKSNTPESRTGNFKY